MRPFSVDRTAGTAATPCRRILVAPCRATAQLLQAQPASQRVGEPQAPSQMATPSPSGQGAPPSLDYVARMRQRESNPDTCPLLMLAPMENLADRTFRVALATSIGGFDEACTEFMRLPGRTDNPPASVRGVCSWYDAWELAGAAGAPEAAAAAAAVGGGGGVALGAQIMGSDPHIMALAAKYLIEVKRAPRVDLNCGCPANTVTGNGAGSSLLRTPERLYDIVRAMVGAAEGRAPVSVKLRAGFGDTSLFEENLLAAQEAGASFITLHPRTKRQAYSGAADWSLTARAVQLLRIPVVGNGDVVSVDRAHALLQASGCHAIMVGRGAVQDPLLFHRIRFSFTQPGRELLARGSGTTRGDTARGIGTREQELAWAWREPEVLQAFIRMYAEQCANTHARDRERELLRIARREAELQRIRQKQLREGTAAGGALLEGGSVSDGGLSGRGSDEELDTGAGGASLVNRLHRHEQSRTLGRLKVVMKYLFSSSPRLAVACEGLLRLRPEECSPAELLERLCEQVGAHWPASGGPTRLVLLDHMNKQTQVVVEGEEGGCSGSGGGGQGDEGGAAAGRVEERLAVASGCC